MTTDQLITRAQHALNTGQPRLGMLYMRKAFEQVDADRKHLAPSAWKRRRDRQALRGLIQTLKEPFEQVAAAAQAFMEIVVPAISDLGEQADYALVAEGDK